MKKLLIASALFIASFCSQSVLANTGKENPAVLQAFGNAFADAKNVAWTLTDNVYKATFTYNGQVVSAFYGTDGTQLALSRNITSAQLPINLQTELKKNYEQFWISDLFEMTDASGLNYYITIETADFKVVLKSQSTYGWSTFQKTKKA